MLGLAGVVFAQSSPRQFDVVVYEATPGGIGAAISAARLGHTVALIEQERHIGGLSTSGLGKSDIETREAIGGIFNEFIGRVYQDYVKRYGADSENVKLCRNGYYYEPSVAERIFREMIAAESRITLMERWRMEEAVRSGNRVTAIRIRNRDSGATAELRAKVFIDGTYEGDLAAYSGAEYRVGREARSETNELLAGVVYMDYETKAFLPGTTGEGDKRIQAYTYRLCLTDDPANSYPIKAPPPGYDRKQYTQYIEDWKAGRFGPPKVFKEGVGYYPPTYNTVVRALSIAPVPNHKYDVNINPRPLGFPFGGENYDYPDANWAKRDQIAARHRNLTLGLLYFLQNDPEIPPEHRQLARKYQLPKDEFTDTEHFPWQLYVREARRLVGVSTLSEHDVFVGPDLHRTRLHTDSIAAGEYPLDSFPTRKHEPGHEVALEGYILMMDKLTHPYQIPYGVIVPKTVDGLLVPVAASTTHIAFASIRLEPTWMTLGQAAGAAAHFAIEKNVAPRDVPIEALQRELLREGQVLTYFKDIDKSDPAHKAIQYFGTKGFFPEYYAKSKEKLDAPTAKKWLGLVSPKQAAAAHLSADGNVTRGEFCRRLFEAMDR